MDAKRSKIVTGGGLLAAVCLAAVLSVGNALVLPSATFAEEATTESSAGASWESSLPKNIPSRWDRAVVTVARSQVRYTEKSLSAVANEQATGSAFFSRYDEWAGQPSTEWNTLFASFCLENAGVEGMPQDTDAQAWAEKLQKNDPSLYVAAADHAPEPGDFVFFRSDEGEKNEAARVGIVSEVTEATDELPAQVKVIEGDVDGAVAETAYNLDDESILGYGLLPEQPADDVAAGNVGMEICSGGIIGMGETERQRIELACTLRSIGVSSVPINILCPIPGTPLADRPLLGDEEILRCVALFRLILPSAYLRFAGGVARLPEDTVMRAYRAGINSAILGDMLTTAGTDIEVNFDRIRRAGYEL